MCLNFQFYQQNHKGFCCPFGSELQPGTQSVHSCVRFLSVCWQGLSTYICHVFPRCQQQDRKQMKTTDQCTFSLSTTCSCHQFSWKCTRIQFEGLLGNNSWESLLCQPSWLNYDIDHLVQDCSSSIALAMELLQSCTKPSIYVWLYVWHVGGNESLSYSAVVSDCIMTSNRHREIWIWS